MQSWPWAHVVGRPLEGPPLACPQTEAVCTQRQRQDLTNKKRFRTLKMKKNMLSRMIMRQRSFVSRKEVTDEHVRSYKRAQRITGAFRNGCEHGQIPIGSSEEKEQDSCPKQPSRKPRRFKVRHKVLQLARTEDWRRGTLLRGLLGFLRLPRSGLVKGIIRFTCSAIQLPRYYRPCIGQVLLYTTRGNTAMPELHWRWPYYGSTKTRNSVSTSISGYFNCDFGWMSCGCSA